MFACLHAAGNLPVLMECAAHFSPLIEETAADTVVFDIRGLQRICGDQEQIAAKIQNRVGITVNLALAANPDAAVHAARGIRGITIVPQGSEAAILQPLPIYLLGGTAEFAHTLDLWGIRTFGDFAALPPLGVSARLGEEGIYRQRLAQGVEHRQLRLRPDPLIFIREQELEDTIESSEALLFWLSRMLRELCEQLRFHGQAANEVSVRLQLEGSPPHTLRLQLPVPILDAIVFLKLLQLELNEEPPRAPVEKVCVRMMPVEPRTAQHGLFLPMSPEPERLEITLARIRKLVGAENVGAPELLNSHRPDAIRIGHIRTAPRITTESRSPLHPKLTLRRFRPPCPARVWCTGHGKPARIFSSMGEGSVLACAGPWQTSGDWWTGEPWNHEEWDVEISAMGVSRIYQDHRKQLWFIAGNYD